MHRKKFLSFLGMAAVAAPILANELPKQEEVTPLELKKAALEGFAEPITAAKAVNPGPGLGTIRITSNGGNAPRSNQIAVWNGNDWDWIDQK